MICCWSKYYAIQIIQQYINNRYAVVVYVGVHNTMLAINDILISGCEIRKIIDVQPDYVVTLLQQDRDGIVNQDEDNIGEFILRSDIVED